MFNLRNVVAGVTCLAGKKSLRNVVVVVIFLAGMTMFSACDRNNDLKSENDIIYGKWQLKTMCPLNVEEGLILTLIDLSPMNIIFEFKANSVLTVSTDNADFYTGFEIGNHFYDVTFTNISNGLLTTDLPQHIVEINKISYGFSLGEMSVDKALFLACGGECNRLFIFVKK